MTQYEQITQNPETLGAFLAALPVVDGPWNKEFHERYCADCLYLGCDACPHEEFRNDPGWWLTLETDGGHAERYAVIVTYHNGARTGAVVEAESSAGAWTKTLALFDPQIVAAVEVSQILTPERGAAK